MTNWSSYKITRKNYHSYYIRFNLNGQVQYSSGREYYIDFDRALPFTRWDVGDEISIDTDKTRNEGSGHTFKFYEAMAYQIDTHWEDKYWEVFREKNSSESNASTRYSNLETERNEWRRKFNDKNRDYEDEKEKKGRSSSRVE